MTVQAQILDLLYRLQQSLGLIAQRTEYVYVMRRGQIVEAGPTPQVFSDPQHPCTRTLLRIASAI